MEFKKVILYFFIFVVLISGISFYIARNTINDLNNEKSIMVKIGDDKNGLITNIGGHYIKIGIILKIKESEYPKIENKLLNPVDIKATDIIIYTLRNHKMDWYLGNQDQIKKDIKTNLNQSFDKPIVLDVYINNFVIQ